MPSTFRKVVSKLKEEVPGVRPILKKLPWVGRRHEYFSEPLSIQNTNLENLKQLQFEHHTTPAVSIIVPVYNKWEYTANMLQSVFNAHEQVSFEIIIIDDCSTDQTEAVFSNITNIVYKKNKENVGFIKSCIEGVNLAKGEYLHFLNNDTQVQPGWLTALVQTIKNDPNIGMVGSQLIYPNGRLQEAGGIVWSDGSAFNMGRLAKRAYPEYNFYKNVDYISGASIVIKKEFYFEIGGFDLQYCPAYYDDTDLAMAVRKYGKKVVYVPDSKVVHFEGISSGTDLNSGVKKYQNINKDKFYTKWKETLKANHTNPQPLSAVKNTIRNNGKRVVLIVDYYVPLFDQNSGSNRLFRIIEILKSLNYYVIFLPDDGAYSAKYSNILQKLGVHTLYNTSDKDATEFLDELIPYIEIAWLCNPILTKKYLPILREKNSAIKIIYDTIDLHYVRMQREQELSGKANNWQAMQAAEIEMAKSADLVLAITQEEQEKLTKLTDKPTGTVPNIHIFHGSEIGYQQRKGLLFIGGYHHKPNIDAALWLVNEIMPLIWQKHKDITLTLLGSNPSHEILALSKNKNVTVTGYIADVSPYFHAHLAFVSPLRYGAGMKGKIGQALEFGLPIVSTDIGIEGMQLLDSEHILVANTAESFAKKVMEIIENEVLWNKLHQNSSKALYQFSPENVKNEIESILTQL